VTEIVKAPLEDVVERVKAVSKQIESPETVSALLGGNDQPVIHLSECTDKF